MRIAHPSRIIEYAGRCVSAVETLSKNFSLFSQVSDSNSLLHRCIFIVISQMLCSISTRKSSSNWLDRLRSSKGFPAGDDLDLVQFLNRQNSDLSNSSDTKLSDTKVGPKLNSNSAEPSEKSVLDRKQTAENYRENGEKEWFGVMSNVLAELFNMGDSNDLPRIQRKKSSRKQPNPKICILSTSSNVGSENDDGQGDGGVSATLPSSGDNSCAETRQASDSLRLTKEENFDVDADVGSVDIEDNEQSHADLSAFSRTDVTVIDTSYPLWKCEKLLFRRKNVWRVREKKSKSMNIGLKKRKLNALEDENAGGEKKPKRFTSSKDANEEQLLMPSNEVHAQSAKMDKDCNETSNTPGQVPKKRFPRKSKKNGSSVILIKSIPTGKKNGANIPKSCL